jgi:hypothetical protein
MKDTTEKTIRELMKFLTNEEGNEIWLLIDNASVISGTLKSLSSDAPEMITLTNVTLHQGREPLFTKDANITIARIAASGCGKPYLTKMDAYR